MYSIESYVNGLPSLFSDNQGSYKMTNRRVAYAMWMCWTKGWFTFWAGQSGMALDFITLLRMVHNLKPMNSLFLNSPFHILKPWLTLGDGKRNRRYGGTTVLTFPHLPVGPSGCLASPSHFSRWPNFWFIATHQLSQFQAACCRPARSG